MVTGKIVWYIMNCNFLILWNVRVVFFMLWNSWLIAHSPDINLRGLYVHSRFVVYFQANAMKGHFLSTLLSVVILLFHLLLNNPCMWYIVSCTYAVSVIETTKLHIGL